MRNWKYVALCVFGLVAATGVQAENRICRDLLAVRLQTPRWGTKEAHQINFDTEELCATFVNEERALRRFDTEIPVFVATLSTWKGTTEIKIDQNMKWVMENRLVDKNGHKALTLMTIYRSDSSAPKSENVELYLPRDASHLIFDFLATYGKLVQHDWGENIQTFYFEPASLFGTNPTMLKAFENAFGRHPGAMDALNRTRPAVDKSKANDAPIACMLCKAAINAVNTAFGAVPQM